MRKFAIAMCALLALVSTTWAQTLDENKPWVMSDIRSGGIRVINEYIAINFGIADFGFGQFSGVRMGQPIQCGTWVFDPGVIRAPYILPTSIRVVCRDRFTATGINFALAVTPKISIPADHHRTRSGDPLVRLHEYLADWADARFGSTPGMVTAAMRAPPSVEFRYCKAIPVPQPIRVQIFEWSLCSYYAGSNPHWTLVAGIEGGANKNEVLNVLYGTAGANFGTTGMSEDAFLSGFKALIENIRYVAPGS